MTKQFLDQVSPLSVQSAARLQMHQRRRKNKIDIQQWIHEEAARKRQRRFAGLRNEIPPVTRARDFTTQTMHPKKLKATMDKQRRVSGMKHQVPRLVLAKDVLYRTTHPIKLEALRIGKTKSTVYKRTTNFGKLFRSVSEGTTMWACPNRGTSGAFRVVPMSA